MPPDRTCFSHGLDRSGACDRGGTVAKLCRRPCSRIITITLLIKTIVTLFPGSCIDLVELFSSLSVYLLILYCTMLRSVIMMSLNKDTYIHTIIITIVVVV